MEELFTNGPFESAFAVYEDFFSYKSGVYIHKNGWFVGYHSIMIIGWGYESGLDYWLVQNSWTANWGIKGFFKMKIGDWDINHYAIGCAPA